MKVTRDHQFIIVRGDTDEKERFTNFHGFVGEVNKLLSPGEKIISITPVSHVFEEVQAGACDFAWTHRQTADTFLLLIG